MKNNPTTMIKCKFSNRVNNILNSILTEEEQKKPYYSKSFSRRYKMNQMSQKDKIEMLDKIIEEYEKTNTELGKYRDKKIRKKKLKKARIERGYVPKKKTRKEQYLKEKSLA